MLSPTASECQQKANPQPTEHSLGTTTNYPSKQSPRGLYKTAYNLLDHAQELLQSKNHRTCICCNYRTPQAEEIDIYRNLDTGTAGFAGLMKCGNVWACPVCARKISEQRRIELQSVIDAAKAAGDRVVMLNLTHSHKVGDTLRGNKDQMTKAYARLMSGRWWMEMKDWLALVGTVRALEITYTYDNGWHVHFHVLLFIQNHDITVGEIESHFAGRWSQVLNNIGGFASRERGAVITENDADIASYVNKQGEEIKKIVEKEAAWTQSHELAKQVSKTSRSAAGRTPFALLKDSSLGDSQASALFLEYVVAMKHARQLVYSNGLKTYYTDDDELTDEQIVEMIDGEVIASIDIRTFRHISQVGARGWLLDAAAQGDDDALNTFLVYMQESAHGIILKRSKPPQKRSQRD